jgi:ubiquinone/menaquinone biosynthesis C-methylase UbiE
MTSTPPQRPPPLLDPTGGRISDLREQFGEIDIYLFDQIHRRRIVPGMRVLDAGCGTGRNLVYFLNAGYEVYALDPDPRSIEAVRHLAGTVAPHLPADNFRTERIEQHTFPDAFADVVVCSTVLHFAEDDEQFDAMLRGAWRVLKPGGMLFCRLASSIGMEQRMQRIAGRRHLMPDGTERYLVDEAFLIEYTRRLGGELLDPIKTTVVQDMRCMTTWVVRRAT